MSEVQNAIKQALDNGVPQDLVKFIFAVQTSETAEDAAELLKIKPSSLQQKIKSYRKKGIELKKLPRRKKSKEITLNLKELAESLDLPDSCNLEELSKKYGIDINSNTK